MTRFAIAFLLASLPLAAQTSSLQGVVTDGQGAAVPEAAVTARNVDTSAARKTLTNALGEYSCCRFRQETTILQSKSPASASPKRTS